MWQPGWEESVQENRSMYHVRVWLNPLTVYLKLSQHSLLVGYTQCKIKSFKKSAVCQYTNNELSERLRKQSHLQLHQKEQCIYK